MRSDAASADPGPGRSGLATAAWAVAGLGAAVAYALGLGLDVLEVDAAQYAAIARDMAESGRWLELTDRGSPFLNKPPLLFWASALSYRLFGVSDVAYRLPSLLVFLLGVYATYRLAAHYAGARAGRWSALALATCQGAFLMNHDVRTDTMLLGFVAFALWQTARFLDRPRASTAIWLGSGLGAAVLTKGPIGFFVPLLGAAAHIAARREWRLLRRPEWGIAVAVAAVALVPMLVGLLRQHGAEGVRFLFWTQGFGRILGENVWGDAHGPLFFIPQLAWIFLPWTLLFAVALWGRIIALHRSGWRLASGAEALTLGAFVLSFVGLSLSRSKLPHYIYVTLPAAAVITGTWIAARLDARDRPSWGRRLAMAQAVALGLVWALLGGLLLWAFPLRSVTLWAALGLCAVLSVAALAGGRRSGATGLLAASVLSVVAANLALNAHVYPRLFEYQASGTAGRLVAARDRDPKALVVFRDRDHAFDFYARETAIRSDGLEGLREALGRPGDGAVWGFAGERVWERVRAFEPDAERVAEWAGFPISKLTGRFLDPDTREAAASRRILFRIEEAAPPGRRSSGARSSVPGSSGPAP